MPAGLILIAGSPGYTGVLSFSGTVRSINIFCILPWLGVWASWNHCSKKRSHPVRAADRNRGEEFGNSSIGSPNQNLLLPCLGQISETSQANRPTIRAFLFGAHHAFRSEFLSAPLNQKLQQNIQKVELGNWNDVGGQNYSSR